MNIEFRIIFLSPWLRAKVNGKTGRVAPPLVRLMTMALGGLRGVLRGHRAVACHRSRAGPALVSRTHGALVSGALAAFLSRSRLALMLRTHGSHHAGSHAAARGTGLRVRCCDAQTQAQGSDDADHNSV